MIAQPRMAWVECVRKLVLVGGPVGIVAGRQRAAVFTPNKPVRMIAHKARVPRRQKWRGPDSGLETGRADFGANFGESAGELPVGFIPVAQRGLKTIIE